MGVALALLAGSSLDDVVRTRIFVTDFGDFDEIARTDSEVFGEIRTPTSRCRPRR